MAHTSTREGTGGKLPPGRRDFRPHVFSKAVSVWLVQGGASGATKLWAGTFSEEQRRACDIKDTKGWLTRGLVFSKCVEKFDLFKLQGGYLYYFD